MKTLLRTRLAASRFLALWVGFAGFGVAGCVSPRLAPVDVSEPGWLVIETPVIWRPREGAPELTGELLVATHRDHRLLVQFSKQMLPLVTAQCDRRNWKISSSFRQRGWGGELPLPDRVPWFQFQTVPPTGSGSERWKFSSEPGVWWRLENPSTGEFVEGIYDR